MECTRCRISVEAAFPSRGSETSRPEHQRFIEMFVLSGGSLKEIAEQTGVSSPTIRSRLLKIIDVLRAEIGKTSRRPRIPAGCRRRRTVGGRAHQEYLIRNSRLGGFRCA